MVLAQLLAQGRVKAAKSGLQHLVRTCRLSGLNGMPVRGPLFEIDTTETTRELRATARRMRMMDALQQCAVLAVIFVASVGLGVSITTL